MGLLDTIRLIAERLCEVELCCLGHRKKVNGLCLLYKNYHRLVHPMNEYLNCFVVARNTGASATLGEFALMIKRCRTNHCSRSSLPAAVHLWNLLSSGVFNSGTLSFLGGL